MRAVVDTNALVSGLISTTGPPAQIVEAILDGLVIPVMSEATFAELEEVLHRPRLQPYFRRARVTPYQLLSHLRQIAESVNPGHVPVRIREPADRPFLELAATRPAPDFIVTGDKDFEQDRATMVCP